MRSKIFFICLSTVLSFYFIGCSSDSSGVEEDAEGIDGTARIISATTFNEAASSEDISYEYTEGGDTHEENNDYVIDESAIIEITLNGNSISASDASVTISGTKAVITAAGTYRITGTLEDGQILVDADAEDTIKILFNGIDISNATNSPFAIMSAAKTVIQVVEGTENRLTDAGTYIFEDDDDEPDAALFSKDDLTIFGGGELIVTGNYNEGIKSKDGLILKETTITVSSVDDGIQGKDYLIVYSGNVTVDSAGDGLKSNNDEDADLGYIQIDEGTFIITAEADAIQAETAVMINGGDLTLTSGGGSTSVISDDDSANGVKAGSTIIINNDAVVTVNAADDAVHSNASIAINGGTFILASGDDAIHADGILDIFNGDITITESVEGIEGAYITISGGKIVLNSSDDGINGAGDETGSVYTLDITGGNIYVNASGDGIDVNGSITMSGGAVIVDGPVNRNNGALDYDRSFTLTGGYLLAVGSSGMMQTPGNDSTQPVLAVRFDQNIDAGTILHLESTEGTDIFTYAPAKTIQSIVFSSPDFTTGDAYNLILGGSGDGTIENGLYLDGNYTPGTLYHTFTTSSNLTSIY
ncbi:carbohydrate-binding domain-containing protein [Robertkochia solimangrovi]|uniref:carbohydrate-binding domain-containing protein n=1 Tax=Robertkochia solimangrovi TaxID=2213046 RepID=UPI00117E15D1|nr:carbohydrate-binding domain-containing protein [Robertkochia solimangrovi]TRZ41282.1 dockerin type 1 [Robertkochia solimangrovi]